MSATPSYPEKLEIIPLNRPPKATVRVPGSKSITNRALVLAALCGKVKPCELHNCLRSEDTEIMIAALQRWGSTFRSIGRRSERCPAARRQDRIPAIQCRSLCRPTLAQRCVLCRRWFAWATAATGSTAYRDARTAYRRSTGCASATRRSRGQRREQRLPSGVH